MLTQFTCKKRIVMHGTELKIRIMVDLEHKEVDVLFTMNGRIAPLSARPPRLWEVDTPAKLEDFMRRINLEGLYWTMREKEAA